MRKLFALFAFGFLLAASAAPSVLRASGECKIVRAKFQEPGIVKVPLKNSDVEIICQFREDDFFGRNIVMANPEIRNLSAKELEVVYHVAFLSKDGELIGSATQQGSVKADGKEVQFGSCLITAPTAEVRKISSYKISVYVDETKPKK
jgi:hypothetical protein